MEEGEESERWEGEGRRRERKREKSKELTKQRQMSRIGGERQWHKISERGRRSERGMKPRANEHQAEREEELKRIKNKNEKKEKKRKLKEIIWNMERR